MLRPFQVVTPGTVSEASAELERFGDAAKVYAGGSELLLILRQGLVDYDYLVNVKGIPELQELDWDGQAMQIGAAVSHRRLERSKEVGEYLPVLRQAETHVGNVRVRNVGTLGGNLCFGDPHSDPGTVLLLYDTHVKLANKASERVLALEDFFVGLYETALQPDELMVGIRVGPLPQGVAGAYLRMARFERPSLSVAVAAGERDGRLHTLRLAVGCAGPVPMRLRELEARLEGTSLEEGQRLVQESGEYLQEVLDPVEDLHGSVAYKTYLAGVLLGRGLAQAVVAGRES